MRPTQVYSDLENEICTVLHVGGQVPECSGSRLSQMATDGPKMNEHLQLNPSTEFRGSIGTAPSSSSPGPDLSEIWAGLDSKLALRLIHVNPKLIHSNYSEG